MIFDNDEIYKYCLYYYLDEISEYGFQTEMEEAAERGITERQFISEYCAARIPGEEHYDRIMKKISGIAARSMFSVSRWR